MLTDLLDNFSFLVTVFDSSFFSVRNEPRICFQKSVIFVCNGRAAYSLGFLIPDVLFTRSGIHGSLKSNWSDIFKICSGYGLKFSIRFWSVDSRTGYNRLNEGVNLKANLRIYALNGFLTSNSCLQCLYLLIFGVCCTGIRGCINYFRLAVF